MSIGQFLDIILYLIIILIAVKIILSMFSMWVNRTMNKWKAEKNSMVPNISLQQGFGLILKEIAPAIGDAVKIKLQQWAKGKKG